MAEHGADLYTRVTNRIIADLEQGVRPWLKPWNAEHAAGRITRPLRHNGQPYRGINVVMLWGEATARDFASPIWMTYKQALEVGGQVRKGEHGSLVVYADRITRTETADNGEETEHSIPFLKGYTVFNCEQIDGLPTHYTAPAAPTLDPVARIARADAFFPQPASIFGKAATAPITRSVPIMCKCRPLKPFGTPKAITPPSRTNAVTRLVIPPASTGSSAASAGATRAMPQKSWSLSLAAPFSPPISASRPSDATIMLPISLRGSPC